MQWVDSAAEDVNGKWEFRGWGRRDLGRKREDPDQEARGPINTVGRWELAWQRWPMKIILASGGGQRTFNNNSNNNNVDSNDS